MNCVFVIFRWFMMWFLWNLLFLIALCWKLKNFWELLWLVLVYLRMRRKWQRIEKFPFKKMPFRSKTVCQVGFFKKERGVRDREREREKVREANWQTQQTLHVEEGREDRRETVQNTVHIPPVPVYGSLFWRKQKQGIFLVKTTIRDSWRIEFRGEKLKVISKGRREEEGRKEKLMRDGIRSES